MTGSRGSSSGGRGPQNRDFGIVPIGNILDKGSVLRGICPEREYFIYGRSSFNHNSSPLQRIPS